MYRPAKYFFCNDEVTESVWNSSLKVLAYPTEINTSDLPGYLAVAKEL